MTFEYNVNKNSIEYDGKHFAYCNAEQSKIVRKLNKLHDKYEFLEIKNQSLEHYATKYAKLYHQSSKENEQLKQFQDRVFSWIDMHLQRLPTLRDDEFESDNEFADPSLYSGAIQILETMKRELKGD